MVFNVRGLKVTNYRFSVGSSPLEIADNYQYLGMKLKPSHCNAKWPNCDFEWKFCQPSHN